MARLQFPLTIPFVEELGLELHRFDNGHAPSNEDQHNRCNHDQQDNECHVQQQRPGAGAVE